MSAETGAVGALVVERRCGRRRGAGALPPGTITVADVQSKESCERLFVSALPLIERVIATIAGQRRLSPDEADEFAAVVQLRIIKDDYAVFRKFRGCCALRTFLTVVIQRMFLDYRDTQWGRWRPSARSRREGNLVMLLERLTVRDGLTFDEACAVLEATHAGPIDRKALEQVYGQLRWRSRPKFVGDAELDAIARPPCSAEDVLMGKERAATLDLALGHLQVFIATLGPEDRLILKLRFFDRRQVTEIARLLRLNQKNLYVRLGRMLRTLREHLEDRGLTGSAVLTAFQDGAAKSVSRELFADHAPLRLVVRGPDHAAPHGALNPRQLSAQL